MLMVTATDENTTDWTKNTVFGGFVGRNEALRYVLRLQQRSTFMRGVLRADTKRSGFPNDRVLSKQGLQYSWWASVARFLC